MQYKKLSELTKLENNPRTIKKEDFEKLCKSIKDNWIIEWRPFLISNRTGKLVIIWGNQRYEACVKLWIKEVPVFIMDWLTVEKEKEIIIRDNINNGDWDMDILANERDPVSLSEWWVDWIPFAKDEDKEEKEDVLPEEPKTIYVKEWDIFKLWNHTLMFWDSMNEENIKKLLNNKNKLKTHCISDPPYWIKYEWDSFDMIKNDDVILDYTWLAKKYSDWFFCMWTWRQVIDKRMDLVYNTFGKLTNLIIWHKWWWGMWDCARTLSQDYELLIVNNRMNDIQWYRWWAVMYWNEENKEKYLKTASKESIKEILTNINNGCIWKVWKDNSNEYLHPTQKPVEINQRLLENFTAIWENVLDLFWWSGSNLIACEKTNRVCYMMELDPIYVQTIIKRFYEYTWWSQITKCLNRELDMQLILG